jgi:hypothetical protein
MAAMIVALFAATLAGGANSAQAAVRSLDPSSCQSAPAKCCYNPCIKYLHRRGRCRSCYNCDPSQKIVMEVADPCCCKCTVEVPMCIPACCKDKPCVSSSCGPFRGVVWYKWCCGFEARVVFSRCGDITVTYFGG